MAAPAPASTPPPSPASTMVPRRTTTSTVLPPGEFFSRVIQGLLADQGISGVFGGDASEMLANPENAVRWYGSYLALCGAWDDVLTGKIKLDLKGLPPRIQAVVRPLIQPQE